jgi:hypothetical protein
MIRTIILAFLLLISCAAKIDPIPRAESTRWDNLTCDQVSELFFEMSVLYHVASDRLNKVETSMAKKLWFELKILTLQNRDSLLLARFQKCKTA